MIPESMAAFMICSRACTHCMFRCAVVASTCHRSGSDTNITPVCVHTDIPDVLQLEQITFFFAFLPPTLISLALQYQAVNKKKAYFVITFADERATILILFRNRVKYSWIFTPPARFNNWQDVVYHLHQPLIPDSL